MESLNSLIAGRITGKRILITGGTTGIGRATAILLASHGARIMIFGRNHEQVEETIAAIRSLENQTDCYGMTADIADPADISHVFEMVDNRFGGIDILINNAALSYQSIMEGDYKQWQYVVQTNLMGYMACCHEAVTRMRHTRYGHILNIGSMSVDVREQNSSVYVATKSAIQGFSEAFRKEVNLMGIKVTLIEPGAVDTDMQKGSASEKEGKIESMEMLEADDIALSVLFCLAQPLRTDIVKLQIRPHLQLI